MLTGGTGPPALTPAFSMLLGEPTTPWASVSYTVPHLPGRWHEQGGPSSQKFWATLSLCGLDQLGPHKRMPSPGATAPLASASSAQEMGQEVSSPGTPLVTRLGIPSSQAGAPQEVKGPRRAGMSQAAAPLPCVSLGPGQKEHAHSLPQLVRPVGLTCVEFQKSAKSLA
ncbi:unnamed protein product [Pipistrellus nathusii]|uniref:Uncharacterized protein n=1 Tax=Pipistrellus nathusii TaxID=59473 RepID=A0ABN9ZZ38_PIPNA